MISPEIRGVKPNIVLSRCFVENVRYDGARISSAFVDGLRNYVNFVPVCPETELGLGTPRLPLRLVENDGIVRLVQQGTGLDITARIKQFSSVFMLGLDGIDGFLLKSGSPSCADASAKIYRSMEARTAFRRDNGFFAGMVREMLPCIPMESEEGVSIPEIRHSFLTAVFALCELRRNIAEMKSYGQLVNFHAKFKLLLMAFSQSGMRSAGRIVANHDNQPFAMLLESYVKEVCAAFALRATRKSHVNVLQHAFGYFSSAITRVERESILSMIERYRDGDVPFETVLDTFRGYMDRAGISYLREQKYFNPYPRALMADY